MKRLVKVTLLLISFFGVASAKTDPSVYLEGIAQQMVKVIEQNKEALKTDKNLAENLVRKHLLPAIDQESFAQRTLGSKTWGELTTAQQKRFVTGYLQKVINQYAEGLSLYDGQAFVFEPAEISSKSGNARVKSELKQSGSEPLGIYYYLSPKGEDWLITNMVISGTSITKSYKTQFLPRIQEIGFDKFLDELEGKKAAN